MANVSNNLRTRPGKEETASAAAADAATKATQSLDFTAGCFDAIVKDGKYRCPECNIVESGTKHIITHNITCTKRRLRYCQQPADAGREGGKRRRKTRKSKRRQRKTRRRHK